VSRREVSSDPPSHYISVKGSKCDVNQITILSSRIETFFVKSVLT
jgi:hypothetical protein